MYLPKHFEETDVGVLHALMAAHPLSTWVTMNGGELVANHIPCMLDPARGEFGTLICHVARANPVWRNLETAPADSLVIFQGAEHYISPSFYPSKHEHGKVVPTWNYAVVHAHGLPRAVQDAAGVLNIVNRLTAIHEAEKVGRENRAGGPGLSGQRAVPWQVSDAPADYIEQMLRAIVGIEIPITRLVGKWKISQNQPAANRQGVVSGLNALGHPEAVAMAALVASH